MIACGYGTPLIAAVPTEHIQEQDEHALHGTERPRSASPSKEVERARELYGVAAYPIRAIAKRYEEPFLTEGNLVRIAIATSVILSIVLLLAPLAHARDLSKYRAFSLGASVADVARQVDLRPSDAATVHQRPARLQEFTWWASGGAPANRGETIQQIRFSFYDDVLYKMAVTYDAAATRGLTAGDVEGSLNTEYGSPTARAGEIRNDYGRMENVLARWEDSRYSLNLFRSSLSNRLGIVVFTKLLEAKANAAAAEAVALELQEAPAKERARVKVEADELNGLRQENLKTFRP
jgi:hypothetical protein